MRAIPGFTAKVGLINFKKGVEGDFPEKTIDFLSKCTGKKGEQSYSFNVLEKKKKPIPITKKVDMDIKKEKGEKS